jgi:glycine oxidase
LRRARDRWPEFAQRHGLAIELSRCGALWRGPAEEARALLAALKDCGAAAKGEEDRGGFQASVFTPEDWRLDPIGALAELHRAFLATGGQLTPAPLHPPRVREGRAGEGGEGRAHASPARSNSSAHAAQRGPAPQVGATKEGFDLVVLATGLLPEGWGADLQPLPLSPIKGQILRYEGAAPRDGPILRTSGVYVVPGARGPFAGATMEDGRSDTAIDEEVSARLSRAAEALVPSLAGHAYTAAAGVRAGTPDGLPLVGPTGVPGTHLALGARRNGWLLAPLVAEVAADQIAGLTTPYDAALAPDRFA